MGLPFRLLPPNTSLTWKVSWWCSHTRSLWRANSRPLGHCWVRYFCDAPKFWISTPHREVVCTFYFRKLVPSFQEQSKKRPQLLIFYSFIIPTCSGLCSFDHHSETLILDPFCLQGWSTWESSHAGFGEVNPGDRKSATNLMTSDGRFLRPITNMIH